MSRTLIFTACLGLLTLTTGAAKADPIMGSIALTVEPAGPTDGGGLGIPRPAVYTSGPVDLSVLPQNLSLTGPALGFVGGLIEEDVHTTFDMKITFDGASGNQPYVEVTGPLSGGVTSEPGFASSQFTGSATSASLEGWTAGSGVPIALIEQYLNLSNYKSIYEAYWGSAPPQSGYLGLVIDAAPEAAAPEPSTLLAYLGALAALGLRTTWHGRRENREGSAQRAARVAG